MNLKPIIIAVVLACSTGLFAQSNLDSLEQLLRHPMPDTVRFKVLADLIWPYTRSNSARALELSDSAMAIAQRMHDSVKIIHITYYYGAANKNIGNFHKALQYLNFYRDYQVRHSDSLKVAHVDFQIGDTYDNKGDLESALYHYLNAIEIYKNLNRENFLFSSLTGAGIVYRKMKRPDKALEYYQEARAIYKKSNDGRDSPDALTNIANLLIEEKQYDQAMPYYHHALALDQEDGNEWGIAYDLEHIGKIHLIKKQYVTALASLQQSLRIREKLGHIKNIAITYTAIGETQAMQGKLAEGVQTIQKAIDLAKANNLKPELAEAYNRLAVVYEINGDYRQALQYERLHLVEKDSILNEQISRQLVEMDAQYETAEKTRAIEQLSARSQIQELPIAKAKRQNALISLGLLLALSLAGFAYYRYHNKQKTNRILAEKNAVIAQSLAEKDALLREIHHRVKNNLQVISSLLSLQAGNVQDASAQAALTESRNRVRAMALIHQNLYQDANIIGVPVQSYIEEMTTNLFRTYQTAADIDLQLEIDPLKMDIDDIIPLGLILNELITNALKYAFPKGSGILKVQLKKQAEKIQLAVLDNGIGFPPEFKWETASSLGFRLIQAFAAKLNATVQIENNQPGTQIALTF